jgi:hypothetical protein
MFRGILKTTRTQPPTIMSDELPPGLRPDDPTAGDRATTDYTRATFTIKEGPGGEPWIMIEPYEPGLPVLKFGDAFLGLVPRETASFEEMRDLAHRMHTLLDGVSYTKFIT